MDIACLHDENILHIFSTLASNTASEDFLNVRQVCKRWRAVADQNLSLWRKMEVTLWIRSGKNRLAYRYLKVAPLVGQVTIKSSVRIPAYSSEIASEIVQYLPQKVLKLKLLSDDSGVIDGHDLSKILQCVGNHLRELELKWISIRWCLLKDYRGEPKKLIDLPKLKVFTTDLRNEFFGKYEDYIEVKCPNLTEIFLTIYGSTPQSCREVLEKYSFLRVLKSQLSTLAIDLKDEEGPIICDSQEFINFFPSLKMLSFERFMQDPTSNYSHFKWFLGENASLDVKFPIWTSTYKCFGENLSIEGDAIKSVKNMTFRFHNGTCRHSIFCFLKRLPKLREVKYTVVENDKTPMAGNLILCNM